MKDLTGLQVGQFYVIKQQDNPNVSAHNKRYWLVEVNGKRKLMRYDNILNFAKVKEDQLPIKNTNAEKLSDRKLTPKQILLELIQNGDDMLLGAVMFCCSLDIGDIFYEVRRSNPNTYFKYLHKNIEEYMNTKRFKDEILNKSK